MKVLRWRYFGGGTLVEVLWWRYFGGGTLVEVLRWRYFGGGTSVEVLWWGYFGGSPVGVADATGDAATACVILTSARVV